MNAVQIIFFPGIDRLLDEELAKAYRSYSCRAAHNLLSQRYIRQALDYGAQEAWRRGLSGPDVEDARQQMALALDEAITRYDIQVAARRGGSSFRSYLYTLLHNRFEDFCKRLRRSRRLIHAGVTSRELEQVVAKGARSGAKALWTAEASNPASEAEWRETRARIDEAAKRVGNDFRLGSDFHFVLYAIEAGKTLKQIALTRGFDYDRLKRAVRALKARVPEIVN